MRTSLSIPDELIQEADKHVCYSDPEKKDRSKVVAIALKFWLEKQKEAVA